jgi:hypothetical protein
MASVLVIRSSQTSACPNGDTIMGGRIETLQAGGLESTLRTFRSKPRRLLQNRMTVIRRGVDTAFRFTFLRSNCDRIMTRRRTPGGRRFPVTCVCF